MRVQTATIDAVLSRRSVDVSPCLSQFEGPLAQNKDIRKGMAKHLILRHSITNYANYALSSPYIM